MDACGADWLCGLLTNAFGSMSFLEVTLFKIFIYLTFTVAIYLAARGSYEEIRSKAYREGFINGIQYYVNIDAYNNANIPYSIDEDADRCVGIAKSRLAKHIHPITPPNCC